MNRAEKVTFGREESRFVVSKSQINGDADSSTVVDVHVEVDGVDLSFLPVQFDGADADSTDGWRPAAQLQITNLWERQEKPFNSTRSSLSTQVQACFCWQEMNNWIMWLSLAMPENLSTDADENEIDSSGMEELEMWLKS